MRCASFSAAYQPTGSRRQAADSWIPLLHFEAIVRFRCCSGTNRNAAMDAKRTISHQALYVGSPPKVHVWPDDDGRSAGNCGSVASDPARASAARSTAPPASAAEDRADCASRLGKYHGPQAVGPGKNRVFRMPIPSLYRLKTGFCPASSLIRPCNSEPRYPWGVPKGAPGPGWPPGAGRLAPDRSALSRCGLIRSVIAPAFFIGPGWLPEQQVRLTR